MCFGLPRHTFLTLTVVFWVAQTRFPHSYRRVLGCPDTVLTSYPRVLGCPDTHTLLLTLVFSVAHWTHSLLLTLVFWVAQTHIRSCAHAFIIHVPTTPESRLFVSSFFTFGGYPY